LAAGLPAAGFAGGSDEPGYTGGSSTSVNHTGGTTTGGGSTGAPPAPAPIPEPLAPVTQAESAPSSGSLGLLNVLTGYWFTISAALTLR